MKKFLATGIIASATWFQSTAIASAQQSAENASNATGGSAEASAVLSATGVQVASGAVAVPLASAGTAIEGTGSVATQIAEDLWDTANQPLEIDDEVVIAQGAPDVSPATEDDGETN